MKKNAFTLVELLSVLVIIGILSAISIAIYTNSISESKKSLSEVQKSRLIEAARTYVAMNTIGFNSLFDGMVANNENSCVALEVQVLISEGLINQEVIDPGDVNKSLDGYIKINYSYTNNQYEYEYVETTTCVHKYFVQNNRVCVDTCN